MNPLYDVKRWLYRGGRPGLLAKGINWVQRLQHTTGVLVPHYAVTLEVRGRRSGRPVRLPVAVVEYDSGRYLVSMLGPRANWVLNVQAAGGEAVLHRRGREPVKLVEIPVEERPPILQRYLAVAPGARPHIPVDRNASDTEFTAVAGRYPVFRIEPR
ncbi:nitroreductase/quinone reductase family protein [Kribbella sp. NPDC048915]|uniref:nitroreductase/quinone reductase family protein n=1 Tax=Kribbella sp. NPDC048915 TaxID=3155148 RepID=UPI0034009821